MAQRGATRPLRKVWIIVAAALLAVFILGGAVSTFYTDLLWYAEVGLRNVYLRGLLTRISLVVVLAAIAFLILYVNLRVAWRQQPVYPLGGGPESEAIQKYRSLIAARGRLVAAGVSAAFAFFAVAGVTNQWRSVLLFLNSVAFGKSDPVFKRDIGFFVFRLPFYEFLFRWLFSTLVLVLLVTVVAHYLGGGITPNSARERVGGAAKAHISVLVGLIVFVKAWGYRLDQFELLLGQRSLFTGASYTDVHARLPVLQLLVVVSIISGVLFLINIKFKGWAWPLAGLGLWGVVVILAGTTFPYLVQRFRVDPSPLRAETEYIRRAISLTRQAYGLDSVKVQEYPAKASLTREVVEKNRNTIDNIRLWDPATLQEAYKSLQEIRPYYEFTDVDVDRYKLEGRLRQVMLAPRELAPNIPRVNWLNEHLVFTHGYGAVVSASNGVVGEGQPDFLAKDIPPRSRFSELQIRTPQVYFGEGMRGMYSIVRTRQPELDYGREDGNKFTRYSGKGGVPASSLLRRVAFAWRFRNVSIALSELIRPGSRMLYHRQLEERLQMAAPFLNYDSDPYSVIVGGKLYWIQDAYTSSSMYPYAEQIDFAERSARSAEGLQSSFDQTPRNYIRNSVKVVMDAYDGTMDFYMWDAKDPVVKAWGKTFPEMFKPASAMPQAIRDHVRYPEDMFRIQASVYTRYHMTDPTDFYSQEDLWEIPRDPRAGASEAIQAELEPYYVLMPLPGETADEYSLILPFNPSKRPNMISWMAARSGPKDYGVVTDFRFPKGRRIDGVNQVFSRMNQDPAVSQQLTLWDQAGSKVRRGNLLVIPMGESLLYVHPLFLESSTNPIPELKKVLAVSADKVAMEDTLDKAIEQLFEPRDGGGAPVASASPSVPAAPKAGGPQSDDAFRQAREQLRAAEEAQRRGDWTEYGKQLDALRRTLETAQKTPVPSPSG